MPAARILALAISLLTWTVTSGAATFEDADSAYRSGHLHAARQILHGLENSGDQRVAALKARIDGDLELRPASGGVVSRRTGNPAPAGDKLIKEVTVAEGADLTAQVQKVELAYTELQSKLMQEREQRDEGEECLSKASVQAFVEAERRSAAETAMERAQAIARATELRQQRALERMRAEITAQVTREIRAELDAQFQREVDSRVAAVLQGRQQQVRLQEQPTVRQPG